MKEAVDAIAAKHPGARALVRPTLEAPLMATLQREEAPILVLADLVWQTAPTPELLRAFAPPAGREKVRPIEGFEMQVEHAGFAIVERVDLPRDAWTPAVTTEQRDAVSADTRGAAKMCVWVLRRIDG